MRVPGPLRLANACALRLALATVVLSTSGCPAAQPAPVPEAAARTPPRPPVRNPTWTGAGVRRTLDVHYYEVAGRSVQDLLVAMQRLGPESDGRRYFGLTTTALQYAYGHRTDARGCRPDHVVLLLNVTTALPRWGIAPGTPYELERDWRHFERALRTHEDGHRRLAEEEAAALHRALTSLIGATCEEVDARARALAATTRARYAAVHGAYDEQTGHGRSQGAAWPRE